MSPEQASGRPEKIGKPTDIYGLGTILYELLTGRPPFQGPTAIETIQMVRFDPPIAPSLINPEVPRDLERICLQCLEKEPEDRYDAARALAGDLRRFLLGRTVVAHRAGQVEKWMRRYRRSPARALAFMSIPILLVAVSIGFFLLDRAGDELKRKQQELELARNTGVSQPADVEAKTPPEVLELLFDLQQKPIGNRLTRSLADLGDEWLGRLPREYPQDFAVQYNVGEAYRLLRRLEESAESFERARRLAEEKTRQTPGDAEAWSQLAYVHERLGDLHAQHKDRKAAIKEYDKAMNLRERLVQDDPRERRWIIDLDATCQKLIDNYTEKEDQSTVVHLYDRRLSLLTEIVGEVPSATAEIERIRKLLQKGSAP